MSRARLIQALRHEVVTLGSPPPISNSCVPWPALYTLPVRLLTTRGFSSDVPKGKGTPKTYKMHHSPADEFVEGLAGGGTPYAQYGKQHDEGDMRLHSDQGDVPEPEYPNVYFKNAVKMVKDAVRGPRSGPVGDMEVPATVAAPGEPVARREQRGEYDEVLKEEADEATKDGRPSPGIALE